MGIVYFSLFQLSLFSPGGALAFFPEFTFSSSCPWPGFEELPGQSPGSPSHVWVILACAGTLFTNAVASIKAAVTAIMLAIAKVFGTH
jgi:hypothetical protein